MAWQKSPESLIQTFHDALPDDPRLERRKMFGYPCAFVGGNMFAGLYQDYVIVRPPPDERARLIESGETRVFEPTAGRPMREYVQVPPTVAADGAALRAWLAKGFAYASTLPPKAK